MIIESTHRDGAAARAQAASHHSDEDAWAAAGFTRAEAAAYRDAWCFDPQAASDLREAGVTCEMAATRIGTRDLDTVGYWVSIGVYSVSDALAACAVTVVPDDVVN